LDAAPRWAEGPPFIVEQTPVQEAVLIQKVV
jgi:hypothetical protein